MRSIGNFTLSRRQQQAMDLKALGHSARQIAQIMGGISSRTVESHLKVARQKIRDAQQLGIAA